MRDRFVELLMSTKREGMDKLVEWMDQNGFFEAPCSGGNHLAKEGGLVEHSLNVLDIMESSYYKGGKLVESAFIPPESIVICALLHDLGKAGDFGKPAYIENWVKDGRPTKAEPEQRYKRSETKPFIGNAKLMYVPHEVRSIVIAERFINLTEEEQHAIYYHNGKYTHTGYDLKETPLQMLLHFADLWASRVVEKENEETQPE